MNLTPQELAADPNTSLDLLEKLVKTSQDDFVLAAVAKNPNTSAELLIDLFKDYPYQVLDNPVLELILLEHPDLFERLYLVVRQATIDREKRENRSSTNWR